jgi:hypothetical protein
MQTRFAERIGSCPVIDLDAGHMCMIGKPAALAGMLNSISHSAG